MLCSSAAHSKKYLDEFFISMETTPYVSLVKLNGEAGTTINQSIIRSHICSVYVSVHSYINYSYGRYGNPRYVVTPRDGGPPQTDILHSNVEDGRVPTTHCDAVEDSTINTLAEIAQTPLQQHLHRWTRETRNRLQVGRR